MKSFFKRLLLTLVFITITTKAWSFGCFCYFEKDGLTFGFSYWFGRFDSDPILSFEEECVLLSVDENYNGEVIVPEVVEFEGSYYPVTAINLNYLDYNNCHFSSITIPNSIKYICNYSFSGCGISRVNIFDIQAWCNIKNVDDSFLYYNLSYANHGLNNYHMYLNGEEIKNLIIPNTVSSIGPYAFAGCISITNVTIPNSVTSIGESAFIDCSGLTNVTIPNSVTSIGDYAFSGCSGLTSFTIPKTVTCIGNGLFAKCPGLDTIIVENGNPFFDSRDNCNAIIHTSENEIIAGCKGTIIPNSVTSIQGEVIDYAGPSIAEYSSGYGAFSGINMDSLTIPVNVTKIGHGAFSGSYIKTIYYNSLDCGSFSPGDMHYVLDYCYPFSDCRADEFIIGNNVNHIPEALTCDASFSSVTIPYSVQGIGNRALECNLSSIIIHNSVNEYSVDIWSCDSITDAYLIGEGKWMIGISPSMISNLYIDAGLTSIQDMYFHPTDVYCFAAVPPQCNDWSFTDYSGTLHVPATSIASYFTAPYWCNFANIVGDVVVPNTIELSESGIEMKVGKSFNLTVSINPTNSMFNKFLSWLSSDNEVAEVNNGVVTAKAEGECDIIVSCLGNRSICHVRVESPISLSLDQTEATIEEGHSITLLATILPESENGHSITWSSSDTRVAVVDNGVVTALKKGECDIIASCLGVKVICHVIVTKPIITIMLDQQEVMILPNHIITLTPSALPLMPEELTASSSDPTVAAARVMNGQVQVVGIKEGTTTITVGSDDETAVPATCLVTVYTELGDVNCDGFRTISDVTSLINYLLSGNDSSIKVENADLNVDGKVAIRDVTALIGCLLSGEWPSVETDDHEWVDLGLPSGTLWATCNVGASAPEEFGDYFAWGETTPRDFYDWSAYNWSTGSSTTMTKYCTSSSYGYEGFTDSKTELDLEDDAAYVNWGKKWRMPTYEQYTELHTQCTWTWITQNGVKGYLVTGPNGNTIFVPAAGYYSDNTHYSAGTEGRYWLSTLYSDRADHSYCLFFNSGSVSWDDSRRYRGFSVRAVRASNN